MLGNHAEETGLRSYPNELVQFVTRQHELEKDDTNDDESIISASNPQNCQSVSRRDTAMHKAAFNQRELIIKEILQSKRALHYTLAGIITTEPYKRTQISAKIANKEFRDFFSYIVRKSLSPSQNFFKI
jgi:hypothetical protein